jgi:hypothetical protein
MSKCYAVVSWFFHVTMIEVPLPVLESISNLTLVD